jgi:exodeoxyribonuclease V alpha subunit
MLRELQSDAAFRDAVGDEVLQVLSGIRPQTVHRLLGRSRFGAGGRYHRPPSAIVADLVVVDEMSMMSTALMGELLARLDRRSRILLVGDHAQLESVENGAVLGQIMKCRDTIPGVVHELRSVRRTSSGSRIPMLAGPIRDGSSDGVIDELRAKHPSISWSQPLVDGGVPEDVVGAVVDLLRPAHEIANNPSASMADHRRALDIVGSVKVLCGPRRGPSGVAAWNDAIRGALGFRGDDLLQPGTPVLVTVNAPHLGLVNGSVGLVVRARVNDRVVNRVAFLGLEALTDEGDTANGSGSREVRYLERIQLADHEPCFAMTVHKSQGSEYGALVVVVLPTEDSPLLTRELLYTAVTRGKSSVWVVGSEGSIRSAVGRPSGRTSAISQMLALCAAGEAR